MNMREVGRETEKIFLSRGTWEVYLDRKLRYIDNIEKTSVGIVNFNYLVAWIMRWL